MDKVEPIENTKYKIFESNELMIFKIPPATTSRGYCSNDWKQYFIWKGKVCIYQHGLRCELEMIEPDGKIYGSGFISIENLDKYIERCYDSMRFFALTLENANNQKALFWMGFDSRDVAFDFIESFQKIKKNVLMEIQPNNFKIEVQKNDYSLKEGEKIKLQIPGFNDQSNNNIKPSKNVKNLKPPPKSSK